MALLYEDRKNSSEIPFEMSKDKIINYSISNYKNGGDMKPIFKKLEDPINAMTI